jgi:malonyl-CoA/methylmalonyl-CoA synthetase
MLANLLAGLDIPRGAVVAAHAEKSVEALLLYLATLRAGFVYLPLNTAYQAAELEYFIGNAEPAVVVCAPKNFGWVSKLAFKAGVAHVFSLGEERDGSLLSRAALMSDVHQIAHKSADDLAAILYTSGTTGRSKGAMLSHGNLLSNAQVLKDYWDWQPGDVLIHALPIFHVHGLFVASHGALLNGSTMLWLGKFDPKTVIARLTRATVFMGVPTLYVRLLGEAGLTREACAHMRLFVSGSAPLLIETFRDFQARSGHTILERYGMSETVMLTSNPGRACEGQRIGGTVGQPLPGVGVRVVATVEDGSVRLLPAGEIGDVQVCGPNVFAGYWRMPEKTAEEFTTDVDGRRWFKTGDVGRFDDNGYLTIVGRSKDLIISGGYNVYPAEIEGYLNDMAGVAESAVIGLPHPDFGEGVVAVIVPKPGAAVDADALVAQLKASIANYKVPKRAFVVPDLPRNAMGKVQKNVLREAHREIFTG